MPVFDTLCPRRIAALLILLLPSAVLVTACARGLPDFATLAEDVSPVVVNISTTSSAPAPAGGAMADFLERFFGARPNGGVGPVEQSLGSGFIVSKDGHILTNYHVIEGATEIVVRLLDRRQLVARVVGTDKRTDLALLKVDADDLPVARIGKPDRLRVGEWVMAIGSPFTFDHSVTVGVVSAKERSLENEQYVPFIQTDVAINPGNSGGPLFNLDGEVIGMNSQIYSQSGGYQGVSFAIPIDVAMRAATQLRTTGVVVRGWLGVTVQEVNRDLARSFGMKRPEGALISRIAPNSPAAEAGLQLGDVILRFGDREVAEARALPHMVGRSEPGERLELHLLRDGSKQRLNVRIGALETDERAELPVTRAQRITNILGIEIQDLSPAARRRFGVDSGGVLVTQVGPGAAAQAGITRGDVILSIGQAVIRDRAHFLEVISQLSPADSTPVLVQRRGQSIFLALGGR